MSGYVPERPTTVVSKPTRSRQHAQVKRLRVPIRYGGENGRSESIAFCKATPSSHSVVSRFGQVYPHTNVRHLKIPPLTRRVDHDDSPFARAHHIFSSSGNSGLVFGGFIL